MRVKQTGIGMFMLACFIGAATLLPHVGQAQDNKVKTAMELMESMAHKLGLSKIDGLILLLVRRSLPFTSAQPR